MTMLARATSTGPPRRSAARASAPRRRPSGDARRSLNRSTAEATFCSTLVGTARTWRGSRGLDGRPAGRRSLRCGRGRNRGRLGARALLGPGVAVELVGERRARAESAASLAPGAKAREQRAPAVGAASPSVVGGDRALADPALVDRALLAQLAHRPARAAVQVDLGLLAAKQRTATDIAARVRVGSPDVPRAHPGERTSDGAARQRYAFTASFSARASSTTLPARCAGTSS